MVGRDEEEGREIPGLGEDGLSLQASDQTNQEVLGTLGQYILNLLPP